MVDLANIFQRETDPDTILEFCDRVSLPDGPYRGEMYDPHSEAPQIVAVQAMDGQILDAEGRPFRDLTFAWCTQAGKSLATVLVPCLHSVTERRESVIYCLPTADLLTKVWIDKLKPGIEGAGFSAWIPDRGPGSRGGRPSSLQLKEPITGTRAGSIIFVAGGSGTKREAGQAGVTAAVILLDEADEYEDAHRIALVRQRAAAFGSDALTIAASTVKKDHGSVILGLWEDSTSSRIWYKCPDCGRFQLLDWSHVRYEGDDDLTVASSARYACPHCGSLWDEKKRRKALSEWRLVHRGQSVDESGNVVGPIPPTRSFGLLCPKLDFAIGLTLPDLAVEHAKSKRHLEINGDHGMMRSFYRDRLSQPYHAEEQGIRIDAHSLAGVSERSSLHKREVPSWAEFITVAVDVQRDRCYWMAMAHGENGRWAIFDWGYEHYAKRGMEPTDDDRRRTWTQMHEAFEEGWQVQGGERRMSPETCGMDSGYLETVVVDWCRENGWHPLKGAGGEQFKRLVGAKSAEGKSRSVRTFRGWAEIRKPEALPIMLWHIDVDNARQAVHRGLVLIGEDPGRGMLMTGLKSNNMLILHLSAEVYTQDDETGKWYWRQIRRRNDLLDCATYCLALGRVHQLRTKARSNRPKVTYGQVTTL